jgi:hypothetical protein
MNDLLIEMERNIFYQEEEWADRILQGMPPPVCLAGVFAFPTPPQIRVY